MKPVAMVPAGMNIKGQKNLLATAFHSFEVSFALNCTQMKISKIIGVVATDNSLKIGHLTINS